METDPTNLRAPRPHGLWRASIVALLGGIFIGIAGAAFRSGLAWLETQRTFFIEWSQALGWIGIILPISLAAIGAGLARLLIGKHIIASGSGVQHVEAIMHGNAKPAPLIVLPIKFFGGLLSIGSGLALGREGPTVQMGSVIASALAGAFRCARESAKDLQAALGGAGLAVAFNAPIGGALFVFEEVTKSFRLRITIVTLLGTAAAIATSRYILGHRPDFLMSAPEIAEPRLLLLYALLGAALGLAGVAYNKCLLVALDALATLRSWPPVARAALAGGLVGLVGWFFPAMIGGGDPLAQNILDGGAPLGLMALALAVRWLLGPVSYSAGTPGGLFSPLLVLGAIFGALLATVLNAAGSAEWTVPVASFAVVGMAAFFTGIVRAPFTGIALIMEMTATTTLAIPMMLASFAAMLTATLARGEPIYDTLGRRMLATLKNQT